MTTLIDKNVVAEMLGVKVRTVNYLVWTQ